MVCMSIENTFTAIPNHLGFIVDGNRRWAKSKGLSVIDGHRSGYETLKTIALSALDHGVKYVSAYVFSTENWQRDTKEVDDIMKILGWVLKNEVKGFHKKNIRLRVAGSRNKLAPSILKAIDAAEELTKNNTKGTVLLCLDYGGQQEIVDAVKTIVRNGVAADDVTAEMISNYVYAPDVPPVDLIIRTSGEKRLSNFMTWRSVYSELMFSDKLWPDYSEQDLLEAFENYATRHRRFGKQLQPVLGFDVIFIDTVNDVGVAL